MTKKAAIRRLKAEQKKIIKFEENGEQRIASLRKYWRLNRCIRRIQSGEDPMIVLLSE